MSENEKEKQPFDNLRKTVELLKPEEKPKSNVHPLFGRILKMWEGMDRDPERGVS